MIGHAILEAGAGDSSLCLVPASHLRLVDYVWVDFGALTDAEAWSTVLSEVAVDAVVNCVGIWMGSAGDFERLQYTVPVALFDACSRRGLRVVHVSALGFSVDAPLPYAATKARADRYLLEHCPSGIVVYSSLVFGSEGRSTRFFLNLAALPVSVDLGLPANLQPVHVRDVARAVIEALKAQHPVRAVECAGSHPISVAEYLSALRKGMGFRAAPLRLRLPRWCARLVFQAGEAIGARFVNRQTWTLLQAGTRGQDLHPQALPYERMASERDRRMVRETQLYWFARLGVAFLWLWTAAATFFIWPKADTLAWLASVSPALGTMLVLSASCLLDASLGLFSLFRPSKRLWQAEFLVTAFYTVVLAVCLPWTWGHPLGPLTKNLPVLATMLYLAMQETRRAK